MVSPVWQRELFVDAAVGSEGDEGDTNPRVENPRHLKDTLVLDDINANALQKLLALACGAARTLDLGLDELLEMLQTTIRYDILAVRTTLEDAVCELLTTETCGRILQVAVSSSLPPLGAGGRLVDQCREVALGRFESFAATAGFLDVSEDVLWHLLAEDDLTARSEEAVFDAVVRWMTAGEFLGAVRGERLLARVRFPLMAREFLTGRARFRLPDLPRLNEALSEAMVAKDTPPGRRRALTLRVLDQRSLFPRVQVRPKAHFIFVLFLQQTDL